MIAPRRPLVLGLVLTLALAACSETDVAQQPVAGLSTQRAMLSEGYSLLYADAAKLDAVELALYVKAESQEFNDFITAVSAYGDELKHELERLARDYPGVRIDLEPLPEMEKRKRFAIGKARMIEFAPLGGRSRLDYERTMLVSLSNALNHERHLCKVMAAEEPDAGLKKVLLAAERRYTGLYERAMDLLVRQHFRPGARS
jgi:hypothetical protein